MNFIQKLISSITAFFASLLPFFNSSAPTPTPTEKPLTYAPASPASYPTNMYQNSKLQYSFKYPSASNITNQANDAIVIDSNALHVNPFYASNLTLSSLLTSNLLCPTSDNHTDAACKNTAVRPLTNPAGTTGYLVRRTKIIDGATHQDTAYVFENPHEPGEGVVLGIESPTPENLRVLDDVAASFSFKE